MSVEQSEDELQIKEKTKQFFDELELRVEKIEGVSDIYLSVDSEYVDDEDEDEDDDYDDYDDFEDYEEDEEYYNEIYKYYPDTTFTFYINCYKTLIDFKSQLSALQLLNDDYYKKTQDVAVQALIKKAKSAKESARRSDNISNAIKIFDFLQSKQVIFLKNYDEINSMVLVIDECDSEKEPGKAKITCYLYLENNKKAEAVIFVDEKTQQAHAINSLDREILKCL